MNAHLDLSSPNFGIQEWSDSICGFFADRNPEALMEIFPGMPQVRQGYIYVNDKPGIGVDPVSYTHLVWRFRGLSAFQ